MKSPLIAFVLLASGMSLTFGGNAFAAGRAPSMRVPRSADQSPLRDQQRGNGVAANGRCGGISYGTGARRCGTLTGGPPGGISSRN